MINANGSSSKPGDWSGGGGLGGGSYTEPGQRSSYDSSGRQLTNSSGQNVAGFGSGWGSPSGNFSGSTGLPGVGGKGSTGLGALFGGGGKGQPAATTSAAVTPPRTPFTPASTVPGVKPPGQLFNPSAWQDPATRLTPDMIAQKVAAAQARMSNWVGGPQNGWGGPLSGIGSSGQPTANQVVNQGSYSKAQGPLGAGWDDRVPQQATYKGFNNPW
jgi:hypothetical protein